MADNLGTTGQQDRERINVNQEHEVAYWTKALGVTKERLREAVDKAGPLAKDVRAYLSKG